MPGLDCSVVTCKYNQDHGCVRDNISVGGASASNSHETCCDSFEERRGDLHQIQVTLPAISKGYDAAAPGYAPSSGVNLPCHAFEGISCPPGHKF